MAIEEEFFKACEIEDEWDGGNVGARFYPPITSDIILKLENILLKKYFELEIKVDQGEYRISIEDEKCEYINSDTTRGIFSFEDALLSIYIKLKDNIDLKQEVQALFK